MITRLPILSITIIVAFCSICYELIFAEALTETFGGHQTRYAMTIGLFLFSFGVGAVYYGYFNKANIVKNFIKIELALAVTGPIGFLFIIGLNSIPMEWTYSESGRLTLLALSHLPIILIGLLSGLELPMLSDLNPKETNAFAETLGFDYVGSLLGTVLFALVLFPKFGLLMTLLIVSFMNLIAALYFSMKFKNSEERSTSSLNRYSVCSMLLAVVFLAALPFGEKLDKAISSLYLSKTIKDIDWGLNFHTDSVTISEIKRTKYQTAIFYEKTNYLNKNTETCMNLDLNIQLCDTWVDEYHKGLVDLPMAYFSESDRKDLNVLVVGGGDWIPLHYLSRFDVTVDMIDIDEEFTEYTKTHPLLKRYHNDSFNYPKHNLIIADGFTYLRENKKKYDLILLDLPGLYEGSLTKFYSTEFMIFVKHALSTDGIAVAWFYPENTMQREVFLASAKEATFDKTASYTSYSEHKHAIEHYLVFANQHYREITDKTDFYLLNEDLYASQFIWRDIEVKEQVDANRVFKPNLDIVMNTEYQYLEKFMSDEYQGMF